MNEANESSENLDIGSTSIESFRQLHFLSINVCGLKSKLLCPEFVDLLNQYEIIGIQESKLDDVDHIVVDGYQVFSHNRKVLSRYRSGGLLC